MMRISGVVNRGNLPLRTGANEWTSIVYLGIEGCARRISCVLPQSQKMSAAQVERPA